MSETTKIKTREITVKATVRIPLVPNFLICEPEEDGKLDIAALTDEALEQIGEQWTLALVDAARRRRENPAPRIVADVSRRPSHD